MSPFVWLITSCWIVFLLFWIISSFQVKNNKQGEPNSAVRLLLFVFVSIFFCPQNLQELIGIHMLSSNPIVQGIGVLMCVAGVAFAIWARIYLSTNCSMPMSQKENPTLITSGPYRFVPHPIYTGICLAMLGSAVTGGMAWFLWFIGFSIWFIYSAKREEKFMQHKFPGQYVEYMKHTKMIVPYVF
jgi:protein-S-isoprenylcysteine O-methyltransferase Ste14